MENFTKEAEVPFAPRDVFNAVADLKNFPRIFPVVKSADILSETPGATEVKMGFNVSPAIATALGGNSQTLRVTKTPDSEIRLDSVEGQGAMKTMNIRWTFNETAPGSGRTRVKFSMDFDTGRKFAINATVKAYVALNARNVIDNLSTYVAGTGAPKTP